MYMYHLFLNFVTGPLFTATIATNLKCEEFCHFNKNIDFFFQHKGTNTVQDCHVSVWNFLYIYCASISNGLFFFSLIHLFNQLKLNKIRLD